MMLLVYEAMMLAFVLIPLFYYRVIKNADWKDTLKELLPKYQGHKKEIVGSLALFSALLLGFLFISFCINLTQAATNVPINDLDKVSAAVGEDLAPSPLLFIATLVVVLFIEEFFFRAFLTQKTGIIISTLIFAVFHIGYGSIAEIIGVFFLGLILAYWYRRNKSLLQNYMGHLLYDFFAVLLYTIF